jgi:hypothetical protein
MDRVLPVSCLSVAQQNTFCDTHMSTNSNMVNSGNLDLMCLIWKKIVKHWVEVMGWTVDWPTKQTKFKICCLSWQFKLRRAHLTNIFAVRFLSGERQRGSLPCVFSIAHGEKNVRINLNARQRNSLPCVFLLAHGKQFSPAPDVTLVGNRYPVRYLCRALGQGARKRHILCSVFSYGARQTYTFGVRFLIAHGKVFF